MAVKIVTHKLSGQQFRLPAQYQPQAIVGKGSYGVVCAAREKAARKAAGAAADTCERRVAIKRIKPVAGDSWDARHTLREVRLMRLLAPHPNIISLHNLVLCASDGELYIVMELMDSDLHQIIQSKQELSEPHHKCLMYQLLLGVAALHDVGVLHRDLKPGNCLVSRDCQLRITDFGLARAAGAEAFPGKEGEGSAGYYNAAGKDGPGGLAGGNGGAMTEYVVTRWYRCPELLLAPHMPYDTAVDLWSVGCIFGELLTRKALFPGKSFVHQVQLILDLLGTPAACDEHNLGFVPRDDAGKFLARQKPRPPVPFERLVPKASRAAREMLQGLLLFNPRLRTGCGAALAHSFFADTPQLPCGRLAREALLSHARAAAVDFSFERPSTPLEDLRKMIDAEVALYVNGPPPSAAHTTSHAAIGARASAPRDAADRGEEQRQAAGTAAARAADKEQIAPPKSETTAPSAAPGPKSPPLPLPQQPWEDPTSAPQSSSDGSERAPAATPADGSAVSDTSTTATPVHSSDVTPRTGMAVASVGAVRREPRQRPPLPHPSSALAANRRRHETENTPINGSGTGETKHSSQGAASAAAALRDSIGDDPEGARVKLPSIRSRLRERLGCAQAANIDGATDTGEVTADELRSMSAMGERLADEPATDGAQRRPQSEGESALVRTGGARRRT